ncbi:MAG TPA: hypothetical protein VMB50_20765 [Myxococcales bacterium]|nr:hypothetical protein [Myxococcales bacterium]
MPAFNVVVEDREPTKDPKLELLVLRAAGSARSGEHRRWRLPVPAEKQAPAIGARLRLRLTRGVPKLEMR